MKLMLTARAGHRTGNEVNVEQRELGIGLGMKLMLSSESWA